jgi:hypothetical protein
MDVKAVLVLSLCLVVAHLQGVVVLNRGCKSYNEKQQCVECSTRYYLDVGGICQPVNSNCNAYDPATGACRSCYDGWGLIENTCLPGVVTQSFDPNCNTFRDNVCIKCSKGFFLSLEGKCTQVSPSCATYNENNGQCTSCFSGYEVSGGKCVVSTTTSGDPNCKTFDGKGVCLECAKGARFNQQGVCVVLNPDCLTYNQSTGACTACYSGYDLNGFGGCVKSVTVSGDPNCKTFDKGVCVECAKGAIFNSQGVCIVVDPSCLSYNDSTGACTACYSGYSISGRTCVLSNTTSSHDPNCRTFLTADVCSECSKRYFINGLGRCQLVSPLCNNYDATTGSCLTCYPGYELQGAACAEGSPTTIDPNCAEFKGSTCTKCSKGYIFLSNGFCGSVSPNCKAYDGQTGACTDCFLGYALDNGRCVNAPRNASAIDPNCAAFQDNFCVKCSKNFVFGLNGACQAVDPLCNGYNAQTGACTGCFESYVLSSGRCVEDKNYGLSDPNCASWLQGVCVRCATRTFMASTGKCQQVSIDCSTYNPLNGQCSSCYPGFQLAFGGYCTQATSPASCKRLNADGSCAECAAGSYLSLGACLTIDPQCANFDQSALKCVACYPGYSILNGACQVSKVDSKFQVENCYAYDQQSSCISCFDRFYLESNSCKAVNVFCKTYDPYANVCLSCYNTFTLANGQCNQ